MPSTKERKPPSAQPGSCSTRTPLRRSTTASISGRGTSAAAPCRKYGLGGGARSGGGVAMAASAGGSGTRCRGMRILAASGHAASAPVAAVVAAPGGPVGVHSVATGLQEARSRAAAVASAASSAGGPTKARAARRASGADGSACRLTESSMAEGVVGPLLRLGGHVLRHALEREARDGVLHQGEGLGPPRHRLGSQRHLVGGNDRLGGCMRLQPIMHAVAGWVCSATSSCHRTQREVETMVRVLTHGSSSIESGARPRARRASASPASCGALSARPSMASGLRCATAARSLAATGTHHVTASAARLRLGETSAVGGTPAASNGSAAVAAAAAPATGTSAGPLGIAPKAPPRMAAAAASGSAAAAQLAHSRDQFGRARGRQRARVAAIESRPRRFGPGSRLELDNLQQRSPGQIDRPHHLRVNAPELLYRHRLERTGGWRLKHRCEAAANLPQRARLLRRRLRLDQLAIRVGRPRAAERGRLLLSEGVEIALEIIDQIAQRAARALAGSERQVLRQVCQPLGLGRVVQRAAAHGERELAAFGAAAHQQDAQAVWQL
eukprot:scaffold66406_cov66-Phaeocystis_antarctica.AAC.1